MAEISNDTQSFKTKQNRSQMRIRRDICPVFLTVSPTGLQICADISANAHCASVSDFILGP